jgi:hypothetical protein
MVIVGLILLAPVMGLVAVVTVEMLGDLVRHAGATAV